MLLSKKTTIMVDTDQANIIGHLCYASYKLWNVCNYERKNYKELGFEKFPNWYYQKKAHKNDLWARQLPSQTAQEVCKLLDKAWASCFALKKSGGIENPNPPKFKHAPMVVTYLQNGFKSLGDGRIRFALSKNFTKFMDETYGIGDQFLILETKIFEDAETVGKIKQIKIYPPDRDGKCELIVVYEIPDPSLKPDNGRYLSIDIGCHNLLTCYDSTSGRTFVVGRKYLSYCHYFAKTIAKMQSVWAKQQSAHGVEYPKMSKHVRRIFTKRRNSISDYLHKITRFLVRYCLEHRINTVVVGDITGIRKNKDFGHETNQQFHALPYARIYQMLAYKLNLVGINFCLQKETYTSQVSPLKPRVCKSCAQKSNRVKRGLYKDGEFSWNADAVGAFNILRLFLTKKKLPFKPDPLEIKPAFVLKVAV